MRYETRQSLEHFGAVELRVEALASLDRTIDLLFEELKKSGDERLLEDLCPYFGKVWPAARGLVECLGELPGEELHGKRVLEVGCGLALPSLVLAQRGAKVTATDFHPDVPWFLARNQQANGLDNLIDYLALDWRKSDRPPVAWDLIVGSDILYEKQHSGEVAEALHSLSGPSTTLYIGDPGRPYLQGFADEMVQRGWRLETKVFRVPDPPDLSPLPREIPWKDVFVLVFRGGRR